MDLRIMTEPQQGASYETLLGVARATEAAGLDGFFRSDHYLSMGRPPAGPGEPGITDAWITLAGLARETSRIRLGTLLTAGTFRYPGPLAIAVAQVDVMSGGRVELGLGAAWYAEEHRAYGIPYPESLGTRLDRLEEQLEIVTGLFTTPPGERFSFEGKHFQILDSPALANSAQQPRPPIIVGGRGTRRMPRTAARFADELNISFAPRELLIEILAGLDQACAELGRDRTSIRRSAAFATVCGADESEARRRAAAIGRDYAELREQGLAGTPEMIIERLGEFADLGIDRAYFQLLDLDDLEHVALLGELVPAAAALA